MRDLFKIVDKLIDKKIHVVFTFQIHTRSTYYNVRVSDASGKEHYFNSERLEDCELGLKTIWGHLLNESSAPLPIPLPPIGIPRPS